MIKTINAEQRFTMSNLISVETDGLERIPGGRSNAFN